MATTAEYSDYTCEQTQCNVGTTGRCWRGYNPANLCPYITNDHDDEDEDLEDEEEEEDADTTVEDPDLLSEHDTDDLEEDDSEEEVNEAPQIVDVIDFANGEALPEASITTITYAFPTKLILIIGGPDCGKTTLVSAISEAFQKGPLGGFIFADSRTQVGFEKRGYLARRGPGRVKPHTVRTISKDFSHLHLSIREESLASKAQHLLFTDVSGERFRAACETDAEMQSLTVLKRADHIFYMVNGEALSSDDKRFEAQLDVDLFLQRAIKNNLLSEENKLTILINKFDKVQLLGTEAEEELELFFTAPLKEKFSAVIADVSPTIARPDADSDITDTLNLDVVLTSCTRNKKHSAETSSQPQSTAGQQREFTRLFSE